MGEPKGSGDRELNPVSWMGVKRMGKYDNGSPLTLDMSDLRTKSRAMQAAMSEEQFRKLIYRTMSEVGKRGKTIIAREVVKQYAVTQTWARECIQNYTVKWAGKDIDCWIPMSGHKGVIGKTFKRAGGKRNISAKIVKGKVSKLPNVFDNRGGNAPFVAQDGVVYTRRTKKALPIVRISGLGLPQMPINLASEDVQDAFLDLAGKRLEHNFSYLMSFKA